MNWIDEQIEYWQKEAERIEESSDSFSLIERMTPYNELCTLNWLKLQILLNKQEINGQKN